MEIANWIRSKSQLFSRQVSEMGMKFNAEGNEEFALDANGEHIGFGMCNIASAAIEEAVIKKFGDQAGVVVVSLDTPTCSFAHQVARIRKEEGETVTADGSFRQIDLTGSGLNVIPTDQENEVYRTRHEIKKYGKGEASKRVRTEISEGRWGQVDTQDFDKLVSTLLD